MPRKPYMKFYPDQYLSGTSDMTPEEKGVYWDVCCLCWITEGVPRNPQELAKLLRLDPRKVRRIFGRSLSDLLEKSSRVGSHFFYLSDGRVMNKRVWEELKRYQKDAHKKKKKKNESSTLASKDATRAADERAPGGASSPRGQTTHISKILSKNQIFDKKRRQALDRVRKRTKKRPRIDSAELSEHHATPGLN